MRTHQIRNSLVAMGLIAAFAAAPLSAVAAQDSMKADAQSTTESVSQATSDTWITTKVKSEFATKSGVDATDISVTTKDGSVMLSGHVASEAEKMKAQQVAAAVKGVKSVDTSGLTITATGE